MVPNRLYGDIRAALDEINESRRVNMGGADQGQRNFLFVLRERRAQRQSRQRRGGFRFATNTARMRGFYKRGWPKTIKGAHRCQEGLREAADNSCVSSL